MPYRLLACLAIRREGSVIGHHTQAFRREAGTWRVAVASDVAVKLAFVTVFRFSYRRCGR